MGRTLAGYEVLKVFAAVDRFRQEAPGRPVGVVGWGEGGRLALYAAALDPRLGAACVSGYFQPREEVWREPLDRNVFGLLERFGDAELAALIAPEPVVEAARVPERDFPSDAGAGVPTTAVNEVGARWNARRGAQLGTATAVDFVENDNGAGPGSPALSAFSTPAARLVSGGRRDHRLGGSSIGAAGRSSAPGVGSAHAGSPAGSADPGAPCGCWTRRRRGFNASRRGTGSSSRRK
jgi:pimeloyl-ACP methyl ester carboxylesterase